MIAQNEINVQGELANKVDNGTVSYKHIWQVYVTSELKIKLFCFFTIGAMVWIFIALKKQIFKFFGFTKICNNSKWTKKSWNKLMQPTISNSHSRSIFLYHVHSQAGFDSPFINRRGFTGPLTLAGRVL